VAIHLVLADSQPITLDGLAHLFRLESDLRVVARCTDGDAALTAVQDHEPDVLVLDIHISGTDGLTVLQTLNRLQLPTRTVVFSTALEEREALEALRLGVRGIVLKEQAAESLVRCVRRVHAGEAWLERKAFSLALEALLRRESGAREVAGILTPRETEVARMVAEGLSNKEVSERLAISGGTVKVHLHHIYRKLKVPGRIGLMRYARSKDLV
jgi:DNA-binding NarL/FixJ family response regulator